MMPTRKYYNQNWLPSIFNDFFDNNWMEKANATAPAINVVESDKDYKVEVAVPGMTSSFSSPTWILKSSLVIPGTATSTL